MNLFTVYTWILDNWKSLGWPVALVFCFLWWNKACPVDNKPQTVVNQTQQATQTAKSSVRVQLVYKDRLVEVPGQSKPLPCPDVIVDADAVENQAHWQSQSVTVTPSINSRTPVGVFLGAGFAGQPLGQLGVSWNRLRISALGGENILGGLATWDFQ